MPAEAELTQVERDKLEIDPNIDFREVAGRPFEELTPNELGMFKWSGVYHQLQRGYFMIRVSIPGGVVSSAQLRRLGELATEYGQDLLCITTRQTLQFHWIRQVDIYKILEAVREIGMTTRNACGDVCRNVVSCSLQGVCPHEVGDIGDIVRAVADDPEIQEQKRNLPRKHKISIAGCLSSCAQGVMNCQGWYPVQRENADGERVRGWRFTAGGGLGSLPHLAKPVFSWVPEDLLLPVARAAVEAHNRYGDRRKRRYARLKIVVEKMGTARFGEVLLELMREAGVTGLERIETAPSPALAVRPFPFAGQSVIAQRQDGLCAVRVVIPRSEMSGGEACRFADWAETCGDGLVTLTNRQNLELHNIREGAVAALTEELQQAGYQQDVLEHLPDVVACVGTTMCNLAVADTPNTYRHLVAALAAKAELWHEVGPLRINMNGCPNSCGQHWIADIGLRGARQRREVGSEEAFAVYVGGSLDGRGHIAEHVCDVASQDVVAVIFDLVDIYLAKRRGKNENFGDFARRVGGAKLATWLPTPPTDGKEAISARNLRLQSALQHVVDEARESSP